MTGDVLACDPWPATGRATCPDGEVHFPGTPGCAPLGGTCPEGDFADDLPSDAVFVRPGATSGDGTRASPFGTIAEALGVLPSGGTLALAKGTHAEAILWRDTPLQVRGACARETSVTGDPARAVAPIGFVDVPGGSVRGVRVAPGIPTPSAIFGNRSAIVLREVEIAGGRDGIDVSGGSLSAEDVVVRGTQGFALSISNGSVATVRRAELIGDSGDWSAVSAYDADVTVERAAILHYVRREGLEERLFHSTGARLRITESVVLGNAPLAVYVFGGRFEIDSSLFVGEGETPPPGTSGLVVFEGGEAVISRTRLERAAGGSMFVGDPGSTLRLEDVLYRGVTGESEDDMFGRAVDVEGEASASMLRVLIEEARETALLFSGAGVTGTLEHVTVRDTLPRSDGMLGRALQVQLGATVRAGPFRSTRQREAAVLAASDGTAVDLVDAVVEETLERACEETTCPGAGGGTGVVSLLGAHIRVERFAIRDSALAGVQIARGGEMDLCDGEVDHNPIGINLQVPDYDITRLSKQVWLHDNGVALDATTLPLPDP